MQMEYKKFLDPETGKMLVKVHFWRKNVKINGRKCDLELLYPVIYFDARFYMVPSPGFNGEYGMCHHIPIPLGINMKYKCVEDCIQNLWWIAFDEWFFDTVVLKTDDSKMGLPNEDNEIYKIYNSYSLERDDTRFKRLAVNVLKANVTDAESEWKLIAMLEFLILNWHERLEYVNGIDWNLLHFAAKYATPNIMRALLQLADKYYGEKIKPLYSSRTEYGNSAMDLARKRTDAHRGEIISLLEEYSNDFLIDGNSAEAKVKQAVVVFKELIVLHEIECQSMIDLFQML